MADDDVASRLSEGLGEIGVRATCLSSLDGAIEAIRELEPDVILVDAAVAERAEELTVSTFEARRCALRMVALPATTGPWLTIAHRVGADAVVPPQVQPAMLARIIGDLDRPKRATPMLLPPLVDQSDGMRDVWRLVTLACCSDASVVVTGETGVGKEVVARCLHRFSHRRHGPFVAINCAALPETLLESELFGHEKGAFTGASGQRKGRFELADGGTLFLDELGDLPLSLQVKLLRVLQERCFERLGGTQTISVDVRIISATHRDLEEEVRRGRFRADLYYRIRVMAVRVPPLRARKQDVLPLWEHHVREGAERSGATPPTATTATRRRLLRHTWPGNVRELQNAAQHALTLVGSGTIEPADLPELSGAPLESSQAGSLVGLTLKEIERNAILETYGALGTIKATAETLGVSERKLHYRLKQYREGSPATARLKLTERRGERTSEPDPVDGVAPRILVAEDDDELRWGLHDFLRCAGYRVIPVRDGRALLEHLGASVLLEQRDSPPDAIVTDIRMPFLTGLQLLEKVRDRGWKTPVVVMSAFGDPDLRRRATSLGAAAFLDKPIDTQALLTILRSVVTHVH